MSTTNLTALVASYQAATQPAAYPTDPVVLTSALNTALAGKAKAGANSDITSLTGLTTPLSQAQGGLGNARGDVSALSLTTTGAPPTVTVTLADILGARVDVHTFGAIGDGTSHPLSERFATLAAAQAVYPHATALTDEIDWAAWQGAIDYVGRLPGGGIVTGRAKTYIVHLSNIVTVVSGYRYGALSVPYSNVVLEGVGRGLTVIKCRSNLGAYGCIQFIGPKADGSQITNVGTQPAYLENGIIKIQASGFRRLTLDGNFNGFDINGASVAAACGIRNCIFTDFYLKNGRGYGFGLENGACLENTFHDFIIENTARDGIDMKNNGDVGGFNRFSKGVLRYIGKGSLPSDPFTGLDISGPGNIVEDVVMTDFLTAANAGPYTDPATGLQVTDPATIAAQVAAMTLEEVVRMKQGLVGDGRGQGAWYSRVSDVRIVAPAGISCSYAISVKDPFCRIHAPHIRGPFPIGVDVTQPHVSVHNPDIDLSINVASFSATTTSGSTSVTVAAPGNYTNGQRIEGPGIPAGTTIVSGAGTTTLVMSAAATASATVLLTASTPNGWGVCFEGPGGTNTYAYAQADYAQLHGGSIKGCVRGASIQCASNVVNETVFEGCLSDVHVTGSGASRPRIIGPGPIGPFTPVAWAANTAVTAGQIVQSNSRFYIAATSGTTGSTAPSHVTTTGPVSDGGVGWNFEAYNTRYHMAGDVSPDLEVRSGTRGRAKKITTSSGALSNIIEAFNGNLEFMSNYAGSFSGLTRMLRLVFTSGSVSGLEVDQAISGQPVALKPYSSDTNVDLQVGGIGTGKLAIATPAQLPGYAFASLPLAATYSGCTVRVTDRSQRLATSDGTNWRFADGTVAA
jgi:hypothetical protein